MSEHITQITRRGSGYGFRCSCGEQPYRSSKRRSDAERWAELHKAASENKTPTRPS